MTEAPLESPRINRTLLWSAFLGPPVVWMAHIGARYPLVPTACARDFTWALHIVTVVTLIGMAGTAAAAVVVLRRTQRSTDTKRRVIGRARFMATAGLALALLFTIVIAAELLPALMQDPCVDVTL